MTQTRRSPDRPPSLDSRLGTATALVRPTRALWPWSGGEKQQQHHGRPGRRGCAVLPTRYGGPSIRRWAPPGCARGGPGTVLLRRQDRLRQGLDRISRFRPQQTFLHGSSRARGGPASFFSYYDHVLQQDRGTGGSRRSGCYRRRKQRTRWGGGPVSCRSRAAGRGRPRAVVLRRLPARSRRRTSTARRPPAIAAVPAAATFPRPTCLGWRRRLRRGSARCVLPRGHR